MRICKFFQIRSLATWLFPVPLLLSLNAFAVENGKENDLAKKEAITKLYNSLIAPQPSEILGGDPNGVIPSIFDMTPGVLKGRVTPVGNFTGIEGAAEEYFWALGGTFFSSVTKVNIRSLVVNDDKLAVEVDINFCNFPWNTLGNCSDLTPPYGKVLDIDPTTQQQALKAYTLTQVGFFKFNGNDKVTTYDLNIINLGDISSAQPAALTCAYLTIPPGGSVNFNNNVINHIPTGGHCTNFWNRQNQYPEGYVYKQLTAFPGESYQNAFQNCYFFMEGDAVLNGSWPGIPKGTWYKANTNNQVCRNLHMLLTQYRPDHCGHSGPKGLDVHPILNSDGTPQTGSDGYPLFEEGEGVCTEHPYENYYKEVF